ncbi:TPA: hypothetical protein ACXJFH_001724 [Enterobacter kobei]
MAKKTSIPRRKRRFAWSGFWVSGDAALTLIHLTEKGEALKSETSTITRCIVDTLGMDADIIADIKASVDKIRDKIHRAQKPDANDLA